MDTDIETMADAASIIALANAATLTRREAAAAEKRALDEQVAQRREADRQASIAGATAVIPPDLRPFIAEWIQVDAWNATAEIHLPECAPLRIILRKVARTGFNEWEAAHYITPAVFYDEGNPGSMYTLARPASAEYDWGDKDNWADINEAITEAFFREADFQVACVKTELRNAELARLAAEPPPAPPAPDVQQFDVAFNILSPGEVLLQALNAYIHGRVLEEIGQYV